MAQRGGAYILAGGGTGGHVYPAIAVAREIQSRRPGAEILFVGTRRGLESRLVPAAGFEISFIAASGFVGKSWGAKAVSLAGLARGIFQSRRLLAQRHARSVFGVGGYASLPVLLAARLARVPAMIEEQNSMPGVANRIANRFCAVTATGFESAHRHFVRPCVWTGNPVRPEFFEIAPLSSRPIGRRVLLFGGSQGSRVLNCALLEAAARLSARAVTVTAQTGAEEFPQMSASLAAHAAIRVVPYLPKLWEELDRADLVVCRAGASTIAELAAAGRPALLVPLAGATHGHQQENAREPVEAGAAELLSEIELSGERLASRILALVDDPARLVAMGAAARRRARPGAARELVDLLFSLEAGAS